MAVSVPRRASPLFTFTRLRKLPSVHIAKLNEANAGARVRPGGAEVATPGTRPPIDALREAVRRAVNERHIRNVAAEVRMSVSGLHGFLRGSEPRAGTRDKLLDWHARTTADELSAEMAAGYLERLLEGIGGRERERVLTRMLAAIREGHRRQGTPPPAWLAALDPERDADDG